MLENVLKKVEGLSVKEMDGKTVITAPHGAVHLNEFMNSLPTGILNKKETGCGATSVVLENEEDVIICCPTRQLIVNKVSQYPNERCPYKLFPVQKGVTQEDIEKYIVECATKQPVKIMVTYDSYPRVAALIGDRMDNYKIIVDEYQELLGACIYRNAAIKKLLPELKKEKNVTYLSATPIPFEFIPEELSDLPQYEIEWADRIKVIPFRIQTKAPFAAVVNMIKAHKLGHPFELLNHKVEEYFFFVNSVKAIQHIVKAAKLSIDEVKIICADNEINHLKLGEYAIDDATGKNKTFNFCTKTVFYGADFHSKAGLAVVVSDGWVKSSLLDISSDIMQIAGRIRTIDNPFKNAILHIYSTDAICKSKIEFEETLKAKLKCAQDTVKAFDSLSPNLRGCIVSRIRVDDPEEFVYYNEKKRQVEIDKLKVAYFEYKFATIDKVYTDGISIGEAYARAGYNIDDAQLWEQNIRNNIYLGNGGNIFEQYYMIYSEERKKLPMGRTELAKDIELQYEIIQFAYDYLGDEVVKKYLCNERKIRDLVHFHMPKTQAAFKSELRGMFKIRERYSFNEIKQMLSNCFKKLCIKLTPKATMLNYYYNCKGVKINNGGTQRRSDGFLIEGILFLLHRLTR